MYLDSPNRNYYPDIILYIFIFEFFLRKVRNNFYLCNITSKKIHINFITTKEMGKILTILLILIAVNAEIASQDPINNDYETWKVKHQLSFD